MKNDYIKCKLVLKPWKKKDGTSGESYCFTNRTSGLTGKLAGHDYAIRILGGETDERAVFAWFNDMSPQMFEAYVEEHTDIAYCHAPTQKLITNEQYKALGISISPSSQPQIS